MSNLNQCKYSYIINPPVIYITHNDSFQPFSPNEFSISSCFHAVIDHVDKDDIPFIRFLMQKFNYSDFENIAIMGNDLSAQVVFELEKMACELLTSKITKLVFSLELALKMRLQNHSFVGTFIQQNDVLYAQAINGGSLRFLELELAISHAEHLAKQISTLKLSNLEKIIWIDNWFQKNIQYIKDKETDDALGRKYICNQIQRQATLKNVFIDNYGVCEDIATSIAIILNKLNIPFREVQAQGHAWLIVELEGLYYLWDCTHNITRSSYIASNGIKTTEYSYEHTLLGDDRCRDKYISLPNMPHIAPNSYSREKINQTIVKLSKLGISFSYPQKAKYDSYIQEEN